MNSNGMTPWYMFLIRTGKMEYRHFVSIQPDEEEDEDADEAVDEKSDEEDEDFFEWYEEFYGESDFEARPLNKVSGMARSLVGNDEGTDLSNIHNLISLGLNYNTKEVTILLHDSSLALRHFYGYIK